MPRIEIAGQELPLEVRKILYPVINYRDMDVHLRINAKGNAIKFYYSYKFNRTPSGEPLPTMIERMTQKANGWKNDMRKYLPLTPWYCIHEKTNHHDPTR